MIQGAAGYPHPAGRGCFTLIPRGAARCYAGSLALSFW